MTSDTAPEALARLQKDFTAHIRDPEGVTAPEGIEDRRMGIYRNLFFNNINDFLSSSFPVLRSLYKKQDWTTLCRDFYRDYRCHTPLFPEIPREFLKYLQDNRHNQAGDPPFMLELAHYEWVELALSIDETETECLDFDTDGDLLTGQPVLSPLAWPFSYQYPVHRISEQYQPESPPDEPTHLLVWRRLDFKIKFMQLNQTSLLLLNMLKEEPGLSGLELLKELAGRINHPNPRTVIAGGKSLLQELRDKQIILGSQR